MTNLQDILTIQRSLEADDSGDWISLLLAFLHNSKILLLIVFRFLELCFQLGVAEPHGRTTSTIVAVQRFCRTVLPSMLRPASSRSTRQREVFIAAG